MSGIVSVYYFDYSKEIGHYDSLRDVNTSNIEYIGLAISTPHIRVNASPTRYHIKAESRDTIRDYIIANLSTLVEIEEATLDIEKKYIMICFDDDVKKYYKYDETFCNVFKLACSHKQNDQDELMIHSNPYIVKDDSDDKINSSTVTPKINIDVIDKENNLGMKWYNFIVKVRPWIVLAFTSLIFVGTLNSISALLNYQVWGPVLFTLNLISIISYVGNAAVQMMLFVSAKKKDKNLLGKIRFVLIFDICYIMYDTLMRNIYIGSEVNYIVVNLLVVLALGYFIWYKLNIKYFKKRLNIDSCKEEGKVLNKNAIKSEKKNIVKLTIAVAILAILVIIFLRTFLITLGGLLLDVDSKKDDSSHYDGGDENYIEESNEDTISYDVKQIIISANSSSNVGDVFSKMDTHPEYLLLDNQIGDIYDVNYKVIGGIGQVSAGLVMNENGELTIGETVYGETKDWWYNVTLSNGQTGFVWGGENGMYVQEITQ